MAHVFGVRAESHPALAWAVPGEQGACAAWLAAAWEAPAAVEHARSRTTDTATIHLPEIGRVVRKRWRWPGSRERLRGIGRTTALAPSPARREFRALSSPEGDLHPRPLAWAEERSGGLLGRCLLLLTEVPGAVDLATWLRDERDPALRRAILDDLAVRLAAMHAAGVVDGDLHPRNVLVTPVALRVWKVDCARLRSFAEAPRRRVLYDLACLDVGLAHFASRRERRRALRTYAPDDDRRALAARIESLRVALARDEERRLPPRRDE